MPLEPMRLARMIALSSELSRRAAEKEITAGAVTVNGAVVTELSTVVDPKSDRIELNGRLLTISASRNYIAYFKPRGFIVTKSDPEGRPTIWEQLTEWKGKLNSVGRLDFNSEGLLILTDDGDFLNRLTHPRHEIWKCYIVRVKGVPERSDLKKIELGVELEDGMTLPAKVRRIDKGQENALIEISIREGRNRQVRRMFDAIGCPVVSLRRTSVGPVWLGDLGSGKWRHLTPEEISELIRQSGNKPQPGSKKR